ncbi:MAG: acetyl/propionyl/methylcrotonyl-CoA carboxylase subunit alpha [Methylocapsa sp.]|nr:acetyl/propionyl/methylcrotonyl-CoA carboxylase subunit alpha [Methylocapsa sp.]
MFSKILIANRGEIACRIIKTAKRLGIRTVAVYSDADRQALHVSLADEAFCIGPAPARESYLNGSKIVEAARGCGAQAIHPGYGFLAENADFAEACTNAAIIFIGPPAAAIRAMGDKAQAKALMERARLPILPGYHGAGRDEPQLAREAGRIGYPVLLKPAAGGGGKGMKIVERKEDFGQQLASAKREALAAFADDRILIEKYLERPRHVEVQIFADKEGNFVHLFDRDCSLQRRHQKVIEEAPAPGIPGAQRGAMREAAVTAARAVGYVGAGTIEFLYAPSEQAFYFLEMNTRLQVEHPVTEMITGLDLVEWQIRIAAGEALPLRQEEIAARGHAIEARLYAEDPARGFVPQAGRIARFSFPSAVSNLRIDTGVRAGDIVPVDYDPLIAKVIVWGDDRERAVARLRAAIDGVCVAGPRANLGLLRAIAANSAFGAGPLDTGFVEQNLVSLLPAFGPAQPEIIALAALGLLCERRAAAAETACGSPDPWSPWNELNGWRLNGEGCELLRLREILPAEEAEHAIKVFYLPQGVRIDVSQISFAPADGMLAAGGELEAVLGAHRVKAIWLRNGQEVAVFARAAEPHRFQTGRPATGASRQEVTTGCLAAPMSGRIAALLVAAGSAVETNQPLLILEAMKMEHLLRAPRGGIVKDLPFKAGDQVPEGAELVIFEAATGSSEFRKN